MPRSPKSRTAKAARHSVTIRDVARRAGVSTATVSRALAEPARVADATRDAVHRAIAETGFTPNAAARSLRARSTKMVLALLPGIGTSFYTPILNSIEEVLSAAGYGMIMGDTRHDKAREAHYDLLVRAGQVDGVLLLTGRLPHPSFASLDPVIPIAIVCNDIPGVDLPVVEIDNYGAARMMIDYLISLGHRRIGHARGPIDNIESGARLAGYKASLCEAGIAIDEDIIWQGAFTFAAGSEVARRFLAAANKPTAMFMANDEMAMGFIKTVRDAGLAVPRDVSVAGFDDIEYALYFDPGLTTINQPRSELGHLAARSLISRITGTAKDLPMRTKLPCQLVIRDSTAAIRAPRARTPARITAAQ